MKACLIGAVLAANLRDVFEGLVDETYILTSAEAEEHFSHFKRMHGEDAALSADDEKAIFEDAYPVVNSKLLAELEDAKGWTAGVNDHFRGWAVGDVKKLMGSPASVEEYEPLPLERIDVTADLPDSFDAREKWTECPTVAGIRDQANCGSCWAFGATEAFNDRLCIASGGKFTQELSAQDTTSCCTFFHCMSMGCSGGQPSKAWSWLVKNGVVSGGDNPDTGKEDTCWPYELEMCSHHVTDPKIPACPSGAMASTPSCKTSCVNTDYKTSFADDKHTGGSGGKAYSLGSVDEIKQSIYDKGPVTGAFTVYADFPAYTSGVYQHTTGSKLGGHAIKIYGWGTEDSVNYWWVANSWNEDWGDKGSFKIKQGDCGIDDMVCAGDISMDMVAMYV